MQYGNIDLDVDLVFEAECFEIEVDFEELNFFRYGNFVFVRIFENITDQTRKFRQKQNGRFLIVASQKQKDSIEGIENKMRIHLRAQSLFPQLLNLQQQLVFPLTNAVAVSGDAIDNTFTNTELY